jgi:DNA-binding transcriptional MerR regulator
MREVCTDTSSSPSAGELPTLGKPIRVGELARRTGKTVRALHLYEELDLLHPVHRSKGGFRLYAPSSVARVQWIGKLQDAGFSLQELKMFVQSVAMPTGVSEPAASSMGRVREVFAQRLAEIRAQMSRLSQLESDLVESLEYLESCRGCSRVEHTGCGNCGEPGHAGKSQPLLVAGLQRG